MNEHPNVGELDVIVGRLTHAADELAACAEQSRRQRRELFVFASNMAGLRAAERDNYHERPDDIAARRRRRLMSETVLTVDVDQLELWTRGVFLQFKRGRGVVVDELACEAAARELKAGNPVLLRRGARLTGTKLIRVGKEYHEVKA